MLSLLRYGTKVLQFGLEITSLARISSIYQYLINTFQESESRVNTKVLGMLELFTRCIGLAHVCACLFYYFGVLSKVGSSWIDNDLGNGLAVGIRAVETPVLLAYLRCYYMSMGSLTVVCFGDIKPENALETAYTLAVVIGGMFLVSDVIGTVVGLVKTLDSARSEMSAKLEAFDEYARIYSLPSELHSRARTYYQAEAMNHDGIDEAEALSYLPRSLQYRIGKNLHMNKLLRVECFSILERSLLVQFAAKLSTLTVLPGEVICKQGERGDNLFLVDIGVVKLEVLSVGWGNNNVPVPQRVISAPCEFGLPSFFLPRLQREETATAMSLCELQTLARFDFDEIMSAFPRHVNKMTQLVRRDWLHSRRQKELIQQNMVRSHKLQRLVFSELETDHNNPYTKHDWEVVKLPSHPRTLYSTYSTMFKVRSAVLLFIIQYNLWIIPFRTAMFATIPNGSKFPQLWGVKPQLGWLCLDYIFDLFFIWDVYMSFYHFCGYGKGIHILDPAEVRRKYLKGRFLWDAVCSFPYDLFALFGLLSSHFSYDTMTMPLKIAMYMRLFKLMRTRGQLDVLHSIGIEKFLLKHKHFFGISKGMIRVGTFTYFFTMVTHIVGCLWYYVGVNSPSNARPGMNWLAQDLDTADRDFTTKYLRAIYYCYTALTTVGYGDITCYNLYETLLSTAIVVMAVSLFAGMVANYDGGLAFNDSLEAQFHLKLEYAEAYMTSRKLPQSLRKALNAYFQHIWIKFKGVESREVLAGLPTRLRIDIAMNNHKSILSACPIFRQVPEDFLRCLSLLLKPVSFIMGDIIIQRGESTNEMYFINHGQVAVLVTTRRGLTNSSALSYALKLKSRALSRKKLLVPSTLSSVAEAGMSGTAKEEEENAGKSLKLRSRTEKPEEFLANTLTTGNWFGQQALLQKVASRETMKAVTDCDMFVLDTDDFSSMIQMYPDLKEVIFHRLQGTMLTRKERKEMLQRRAALHWDMLRKTFVTQRPPWPDIGELIKNLKIKLLSESSLKQQQTRSPVVAKTVVPGVVENQFQVESIDPHAYVPDPVITPLPNRAKLDPDHDFEDVPLLRLGGKNANRGSVSDSDPENTPLMITQSGES